MKKITALLLIFILIISMLSACGSAPEKNDAGLTVVTTIFPVYDWLNEVLGDADAEVTMLLDSGVDLHSYQPTADDMIKISTCDVFVYVGGESDEWVEDALKTASNKSMTVVNLMDALGGSVKEEETVEGMQSEEEEEGDELEYDEHIWLSLRNAAVCCEAICTALSSADQDNSAKYSENAEKYIAEIKALDAEYQSAVDSAAKKALLFGDRFPFRYLADDYGLTYYAAFSGCSAESEASFETIAFLSDKLRELGLKAVVTLEGSDGKLAETIIQTSGINAEILAMDSMQSVTAKNVTDGADYLSTMQRNLETLKAALG